MNKIRLSKFAFDEKYPISDLVKFFNQNGFNKKEDPNELITEDEIQFARNNFNSFLQQDNNGYNAYKNNFLKNIGKKTDIQTPIQLKIIEAASKEKLLVERIIGFTEFNWEFLIAKFSGLVSQPVPFSIIDEVICNLLLVENLPKSKIGKLLGLNVTDDPAERMIIDKSIKSLVSENIIEEKNSIYELTKIGKEYAENGVKYSYFNREFNIYFDLTGRNQNGAKSELKKLKSQKIESDLNKINLNLDQLKEFVIHQAPEVHFPEKKYILQSASLLSAEKYSAPLWAVFLDNFKDNKTRVIVYDENQDQILEQLSADFNKREDLKTKLFESLIVNSEEISPTTEAKSIKQLEEEKRLIEKQLQIEAAEVVNDISQVDKIKEGIKFEKRSFNSIEFELELKHIFEKKNDELWFISPWLRFHAIKFRYDYFEQQLRQGAKIFIVYSEPENHDSVMVDPRAKELLDKLESKYSNFYIHQLPKFHYKNVWIKNNTSENILYTGSFNILSFYVDTNSKNYRQEQMIKIDWDEETESMYKDFISQFGMKYIGQESKLFFNIIKDRPEEITADYLNKIKTFDTIKMNTFRNLGFETFDNVLNDIEEKKNKELKEYGTVVFLKELEKIKISVEKLSTTKITKHKKKSLIEAFEYIIEEFDYLQSSHDNELSELRKVLSKLKTLD